MADTNQEVRVRFSAEGMAEVVSAFRQVSAEGRKSARDTADAFTELNRQFSELGRTLLSGLTLVAIADGLKRLFQGALDSASALQRLSQQTGLSTSTIQAFQRAAVETGSSTEAANAAVAKFTQQVGRAEIGTKQSANALADLGINLKDFKSLSPDEQLLAVARGLANIPDPARRARDEVALFSRGSLELDQALVRIGNEGIDPFIAKLKELGIFLDAQAIAQLKALKLQLDDSKNVVAGMAQQFLVGLAPALGAAADGFVRATEGGEGFKKVGQFIGSVILFLEQGFQAWGITIGAIMARAGVVFTTFGEVVSDVFHGNLAKARDDYAAGMRQVAAINQAALEDMNRLQAEIDKGPAAAKVPTPGTGGGAPPPEVDPNADAKAKARLALINAQLDTELKLFEANSKLELDQAKTSYEQGLTSLEDYFKRRAEIIAAEYDKQIEIAKRKLAAEQALPAAQGANAEVVELQRAAAQEKLRGEIAQLNAAKEVALQQNKNELITQELSLTQRRESAEEKLLALEGKREEAARRRLNIDIQALQKELQASGASPGEVAAAVGTARTQGEAKIGFDAASKEASASFLSLQTAIKAEQDKINAGQEFQLTGEEHILAIERQRLPLLQQQADAMLKFAQQANDPALIAQAEAFREKVNQISVATNDAAKYMKELHAGIENAFSAGLNTFLDEAILKSKGLGKAFDDAAKQILQDLAKMALKIEEEKFLKWIFGGGLGGGGGGGGGGALAFLGFSAGGLVGSAGEPRRFAGGGYVRGPGSTTSDSIPALVSDREFIVNAGAVARPGVLSLLEAINTRPDIRLPGFTTGGLVGVNIAAAARSGRGPHGASPVVLHIAPEAMHFTLRDWFEREIADIANKR